MPLSEVDRARFDNLARQASTIDYDLADEQTRAGVLIMKQPQIDQIKALYDAYGESVQAAIRQDLMPRLNFTWDIGYEKCPHCVRGRFSPDREETTPVLDANGNPKVEKQLRPLFDEDGNMLMNDDGQPMTKEVDVPVVKPIAIEKETCPHCNGAGERLIASVAE